jgi:hypothetical protein
MTHSTRTTVLAAAAVTTVIGLGVLAELDPRVKETGTVIGAYLLGLIVLVSLGAMLLAPLLDWWSTDHGHTDHGHTDGGHSAPETAVTTARAPHTGILR